MLLLAVCISSGVLADPGVRGSSLGDRCWRCSPYVRDDYAYDKRDRGLLHVVAICQSFVRYPGKTAPVAFYKLKHGKLQPFFKYHVHQILVLTPDSLPASASTGGSSDVHLVVTPDSLPASASTGDSSATPRALPGLAAASHARGA